MLEAQPNAFVLFCVWWKGAIDMEGGNDKIKNPRLRARTKRSD
jgi:hypothetical protein